MEVHLDSRDTPMGQDKSAGKRRRPNGRTVPSPADVADHTGRLLAEREHDWGKATILSEMGDCPHNLFTSSARRSSPSA
jgi:hypothetical protein